MNGDAARPQVTGFHDPRTGSVQYVLACPETGRCALIDPVLDLDPKAGRLRFEQMERLLAHVRDRGLSVDWIIDTHPHADHLSAMHMLKDRTGARTATGAAIGQVQRLWRDIYGLPESFPCDGRQWDRLLADGDEIVLGSLRIRAMNSFGHTLCSISLLAGDAAFIHDTLFMPDSGTARADFPGADPAALWRSINRILALPESTRLFSGHDYRHGGRPAAWESTPERQRRGNSHLAVADEAAFVALRRARDATLSMPALILHALQVNISAGRLPDAGANGRRLLRVPLDVLPSSPW